MLIVPFILKYKRLQEEKTGMCLILKLQILGRIFFLRYIFQIGKNYLTVVDEAQT